MVKDDKGTWSLPTVTGKMVCTLMGEFGNKEVDLEIAVPVMMDPKDILAVQLAEIPCIIESYKANGCQESVVTRIKSLLGKAAQDYANFVTKLPPLARQGQL